MFFLIFLLLFTGPALELFPRKHIPIWYRISESSVYLNFQKVLDLLKFNTEAVTGNVEHQHLF